MRSFTEHKKKARRIERGMQWPDVWVYGRDLYTLGLKINEFGHKDLTGILIFKCSKAYVLKFDPQVSGCIDVHNTLGIVTW